MHSPNRWCWWWWWCPNSQTQEVCARELIISGHYRASLEPLEEAKMYLNRDMDGGPFLVYFLPILGGQKAAVSDSVEGWLPGRRMVCNWQPRSFQGVDSHGWPNGWTKGRHGRMTGRAGSGAASFLIPTSFIIYNVDTSVKKPIHLLVWTFENL